jgi:hypothetical protein
MRHKSILSMIFILICFLSACNKDEELSLDDSNVMGSWNNPTYEEPYWKYEKAQTIQDDGYGFSFNENQVFIERKNGGECGTPPIAYDDFYGKWTQTDSILHIQVGYWGGEMNYEWKIISIDNKYLIIDKVKEDIIEGAGSGGRNGYQD